ncbi:molybdenum ABC transporter ATP-binding protein [Rhizobiaceae bacterium BDR2-2]|uniref:Molybdenum ABC transporter ATP-binding protein n=1 Tax=Ectorhizobium quercum TaxID=2965071 RepID=A0AAE3N089_9HYPH|nr:molybdenum ABC transporter ATP-binding protein [Ectorhizobium quercum]MCX8996348.1 molybdenum ABC transporter ATP-binding protein [Ectorhizobium quercum]MCX8998613.1 molybdenum ABC transporter ATP-binding protein [Ectorhizobium quercum]
MTLQVDITQKQGDFTLRAAFSGADGLTALSGPSGSGKTTLINLIAGLVPLQEGRIVFGGTVWNDTRKGIFVPPHRRRIGYVFQEARLFPHISVRANLAYGMGRVPKAERPARMARVAGLLRIDHLLDRRPSGLSGGEKQRVALGRALLSAPDLLLMDEPLSALDAALKAEILPDIERIRDAEGIPILYISHSMEEVARLATRVVAMEAGRVVATGGPEAALASAIPGKRAGAFLDATIAEIMDGEGLMLARSAAGPLYLLAAPVSVGKAVRVFVPASEVMLSVGLPQEISALNRLSGTVAGVKEGAASVTVELDCGGETVLAEVTRRSAERLGIAPGVALNALFKAVRMEPESLFRQTGQPDLSEAASAEARQSRSLSMVLRVACSMRR